jgi:hypothetical protein
MANGYIIKNKDVNTKGSVKLELPQLSSSPSPPTQRNTCPAEAKVIKTTNSFAIIEVTCSCGRKVQLKCQYEQQAQAAAANPS